MLNSDDADSFDASKLRYCVSGGAPMPVEVMREFNQRFSVKIQEGYGLSETSPVASFETPRMNIWVISQVRSAANGKATRGFSSR